MEMVSQRAETSTIPHSPADIELENEVAETPTSESPRDMEVESHDAERPTAFQRTKQFIQRHSKLLQLLVFFTKETVDTTLDWLLFNELNTQDEGLVFGAVSSWLLCLLFTFCCIGTVLTFLDISNRVHELRTGSPFMHTYIPEILTLMLEDIPQLSIGLYILLCRGQTINSIARVKAGFLLFGSVLYLVYTTLTMTEHMYHEDRLGAGLKYLVLNLCLGTMAISVVILLSTTTSSFSAFDPFDILKNETKRDQYFSRVAIYVRTDDLQTDDLKNTTNWMKLFEVYDILGNDEISVQIMTDPSHVRVQTFYGPFQKNDTDICYRVNGTFEDEIFFTEASDCSLLNGTTWYYRFKYIQPSMQYLLGDIQYNVRKTATGSCENIAIDYIPDLKYFRAVRNVNLTGPLYGPVPISRYEWEWDANFSSRKLIQVFYLNKGGYIVYSRGRLSDIKYVWKPPFNCVNVEFSPHLNPDITVPCQL